LARCQGERRGLESRRTPHNPLAARRPGRRGRGRWSPSTPRPGYALPATVRAWLAQWGESCAQDRTSDGGAPEAVDASSLGLPPVPSPAPEHRLQRAVGSSLPAGGASRTPVGDTLAATAAQSSASEWPGQVTGSLAEGAAGGGQRGDDKVDRDRVRQADEQVRQARTGRGDSCRSNRAPTISFGLKVGVVNGPVERSVSRPGVRGWPLLGGGGQLLGRPSSFAAKNAAAALRMAVAPRQLADLPLHALALLALVAGQPGRSPPSGAARRTHVHGSRPRPERVRDRGDRRQLRGCAPWCSTTRLTARSRGSCADLPGRVMAPTSHESACCLERVAPRQPRGGPKRGVTVRSEWWSRSASRPAAAWPDRPVADRCSLLTRPWSRCCPRWGRGQDGPVPRVVLTVLWASGAACGRAASARITFARSWSRPGVSLTSSQLRPGSRCPPCGIPMPGYPGRSSEPGKLRVRFVRVVVPARIGRPRP
jgi:hypothetical protein